MSLLMRRVLSLALLFFVSAAYAQSTQPVIKVRQLPRSEFDVEQRGATSVAYEMTIRNPSQQAITLRKVTMKTVGRSPYTLKSEALTFDTRIEPGAETTVTLSLWAYRRDGGSKTVWVRGKAHFEDGVMTFSDSFTEPD